MLKNIKIAMRIIICYLLIMIIGLGITNSFLSTIKNGLGEMIGLSITQLLSSGYIIYMVKRFYGWNNVGFNKINIKNMIWFVPYILIIVAMMYTFIKGFYQNVTLIDKSIWIVLIITFIGTSAAGFSEEVIFRGMLLNMLKYKKSIIIPMIISSVGFSIIHITTMFMGISFIDAIVRVIHSSLLGFSFVAIAIKLNNIWPIIIFHVLWNFILMASQVIGIEVSTASLICNHLNIIIAIILWTLIIIEQRRNRKLIFSRK